jgi:hypothetical protein
MLRWAMPFVQAILAVLSKTVDTADISDFSLILHSNARVISRAHKDMTRDDYLLTAAYLCQHKTDETTLLSWRGERLEGLFGHCLERYSLVKVDSHNIWNGSCLSMEISGIRYEGSMRLFWAAIPLGAGCFAASHSKM